MTVSDLRTLVDYNYWSRDRLFDALGALSGEQFLKPMGNSFSSIRDTLVHIYSAEWVWYTRWQGQSPATPLAADQWPDLASLAAAWRDLEVKVRAFVGAMSEDAVSRMVDYRLLNGQPGRSEFGQMVQHVVNHGTYHRGQVTTMLRQLGASPAKSLDLITYYRERQG